VVETCVAYAAAFRMLNSLTWLGRGFGLGLGLGRLGFRVRVRVRVRSLTSSSRRNSSIRVPTWFGVGLMLATGEGVG